MNDYLSEVFGDGGLFASRFPGYEMREGQVALARMVDEAMRGGRHALGEGPCGTGKSVAYAVPAVHHAHHEKKRVVIATANIALQEQLVRKDLPMLASVLPWPFTFALLKGRNNYVCLDRMAESEARGELRGLYYDDQQRQVDEVLAWAEATKTGDVSELAFIPHAQVWSKFSVGSEDCKGDGCPFRDDCYAERAKATAQGADIVVTNYHMLFAHLAVRQATGQDLVLPAFDLLVLDEAHEAAEIAREFFGFTLSEHTFGRLASAAVDLGNKQLAGELRQEAQRLFATLADFARSPRYKKRLKAPGFAKGDLVFADTGWQEYAVLPAKALTKQQQRGPLSHLLSVYGIAGLTAYFGLLEVGKPKPGETVVVSAASGAVGQVVGQFEKVEKTSAVIERWVNEYLEATSHLDVDCEQAVNRAIQSLALTRILIAHRPETILSAERVVVLTGGKVVDDLSTAELLARQAAAPAQVPTQAAVEAG